MEAPEIAKRILRYLDGELDEGERLAALDDQALLDATRAAGAPLVVTRKAILRVVDGACERDESARAEATEWAGFAFHGHFGHKEWEVRPEDLGISVPLIEGRDAAEVDMNLAIEVVKRLAKSGKEGPARLPLETEYEDQFHDEIVTILMCLSGEISEPWEHPEEQFREAVKGLRAG